MSLGRACWVWRLRSVAAKGGASLQGAGGLSGSGSGILAGRKFFKRRELVGWSEGLTVAVLLAIATRGAGVNVSPPRGGWGESRIRGRDAKEPPARRDAEAQGASARLRGRSDAGVTA